MTLAGMSPPVSRPVYPRSQPLQLHCSWRLFLHLLETGQGGTWETHNGRETSLATIGIDAWPMSLRADQTSVTGSCNNPLPRPGVAGPISQRRKTRQGAVKGHAQRQEAFTWPATELSSRKLSLSTRRTCRYWLSW